VRSTFSELTTTARLCALAEVQAGLACRHARSRLQLQCAGIPLSQPDVPAIKQPGWSLVSIRAGSQAGGAGGCGCERKRRGR
jgi:hypothetical protein